MTTPLYPIRLDAATRAALEALAAKLVPDAALTPRTRSDASRVAAMLRMIADGRLTLTVTETQPAGHE